MQGNLCGLINVEAMFKKMSNLHFKTSHQHSLKYPHTHSFKNGLSSPVISVKYDVVQIRASHELRGNLYTVFHQIISLSCFAEIGSTAVAVKRNVLRKKSISQLRVLVFDLKLLFCLGMELSGM